MNIDGQTFPTIFIFPEKVKKIWHYLRIFLRFWLDALKTASQITSEWKPLKKRIIIRKMYCSFENKINCCKTPFQIVRHSEVSWSTMRLSNSLYIPSHLQNQNFKNQIF
jgi:hypothetical protein